MILYTTGDIKTASAFANPVNLVGVMGAGLAKQVATKWPACIRTYQRACRNGTLRPGRVLSWRRPDQGWIVQTPTKTHWKHPSDLALVTMSINALLREADRLKLDSIAVPPLGRGLGGLNWNDVRLVIESASERYPELQVRVYGRGTP